MIIQARRMKFYYDNKIAAELAFLQAQIKPHFLFNSLNTFISISYYDIEKARELLTDFSCYLRRSIDFKNLSQFVPLKNEIELSKAYIKLEQARFEERVSVSFNSPEDINVSVPILMLQPIIENAIVHGLLSKLEGGKVGVFIERDGSRVLFRVTDNGVGMNSETISGILQAKSTDCIGLANIQKRLEQLYGSGLKIKSEINKGTEISWTIPLKRSCALRMKIKKTRGEKGYGNGDHH